MTPQTLPVTYNDTSAQQWIVLLDTLAKQETIVLPGSQGKFKWELFRDAAITSVRVPRPLYTEAYQTMLASEAVLRRDWDQPDEDAAWAHL